MKKSKLNPYLTVMISIYQEGDEIAWIPVAQGLYGGTARAFLPINGFEGSYTYGYKASPSRGKYFVALRAIQKAHIDGETKVFYVEDGKKKDEQRGDKWRHGSEKGSPLLSPSLGWVGVPLAELEKVTDDQLGKALQASAMKAVLLPLMPIAPVLCDSFEQLVVESEKLRSAIHNRKPVGQTKPEKIPKSVERYVRDAAVVAYVLNAAAGLCECCGKLGPFEKPNGEPYLEVHHVVPLADKGSDTVTNAVAICPNCHRELHYGQNSEELAEELYSRIKRLARE